jgi:N-acetyl-gamma-glutamyl-phosphate reductase
VSHRIGVVGASGYGGAELLRLLDGHPTMDAEVVAARSQAGETVSSLFPNLRRRSHLRPDRPRRARGARPGGPGHPHGAALELGAALYDAGTPVVDLSAAFRLSVDGFATWYGEAHPRPELAAGDDAAAADVAYGLPELERDRILGASLVANPGCYPTATLLALAPLAELLVPGSIVVDAKSGTSGAGRAATDRLHFAHVHGSLTAYGAPVTATPGRSSGGCPARSAPSRSRRTWCR